MAKDNAPKRKLLVFIITCFTELKNYLKQKIIYKLILALIVLAICSCGKTDKISKECSGIITCHTNLTSDSDTLIFKAYHEILFEQDFSKAESTLVRLINDANIKRDNKRQVKYLTDFFMLPGLASWSNLTSEYLVLCDELMFDNFELFEIWNLTYSLFNYYYQSNDEKMSLSFASKLLDLAVKNNEEGTTALAYLAAGLANELDGRRKLAVSYLFNALTHANRSIKINVLIEVNEAISNFYSQLKMIDNALEYKSTELELRTPKSIYDSLEYFQSELFYHELVSASNPDQSFDTSRVFYIIDFAKKRGAKRLLTYSTAFLRTNLLNSNRLKDLNEYYTGRGKDELNELRETNTSVYFSLKGIISEINNDVESASEYYGKAIEVLDIKKTHPARMSTVNLQYGEFLDRNGFKSQSKNYYYKAFQFVELSNDVDFKLTTYKRLSDFLERNGEFKEALKFKNFYYSLSKYMTKF